MLSRVLAAPAAAAPTRRTVIAAQAPRASSRAPRVALAIGLLAAVASGAMIVARQARRSVARCQHEHDPARDRAPSVEREHEHGHARGDADAHRPLPAPPVAKPAVAMGSLSVNASPWATVRVNGKLAGTTPILRFPVRAGRASVTIENPKLGRKQVDVKIEPKKDTPLIVDLHSDHASDAMSEARRPRRGDADARRPAHARAAQGTPQGAEGSRQGDGGDAGAGRDPDRRRRRRPAAPHRSDGVAQPLHDPADGEGAAAARSRVDNGAASKASRCARRSSRAARRWSSGTAGPLRGARRIRRAAARRLGALRPAVGTVDRHAPAVRARRTGRRLRRHGADRRRDRHRQGRAVRGDPPGVDARRRPADRRRLRRDAAQPDRDRSCSATSAARSPAPIARAPARSRRPTAARCSSTRSASCRWSCSRSCCACSRRARCAASARPSRARSTSASSPPPTATCARR